MKRFSSQICAIVLLCGLGAQLVLALTEDECTLKPEEVPVCCKEPKAKVDAKEDKGREELGKKCVENNAKGKKATTDDEEFQIAECVDECIFRDVFGYVNKKTNKLDETAIVNTFTKRFDGNSKWKEATQKVAKSCLGESGKDIKASSKCKSGALQFLRCYTRGVFLNCPAESWDNTPACNKLKTLVQKCPNVYTILQN
ncbi:general odorant-binding protein 68 [Halyomorpha halys]|uniref:Odorant-binding protein 10 n=1 Tax=Halyomorpha halys TaxID=286706 RepID=A0A1L2JGP8_HALHY|nr:general odorant-binding protein 66 [Halyomorpha halys]AOV87027.1 odorant-binding protein 10 [Halyomorpha halys]KAE8573765.1 Odorant-binding protein 10 [Halyomorpha halys]